MKRTPLKRKTPLKRGTKGLKRTPLKKKSDKRKTQDEVYFARRAGFLAAIPTCQFRGCRCKSRDVHHKAGRTGSNYLDMDTWMAVCRKHHDFIHDNPTVARMFGMLTKP